LVRPFLEELSRAVGEGVSLAILDGPDVRFLDQAITGHGLRAVSLVGSAFPAHCTANGKALLAELPQRQLETVLPKRLQRFTTHTIVKRSDLLSELDRVRESGIAVDLEEHTDGICAIGKVIHDAVGNLAAITIAMPAQRFSEREKELSAVLTEATDRITSALSHRTYAGAT
jgi:DNA-binding IclR family transcriptional regulator